MTNDMAVQTARPTTSTTLLRFAHDTYVRAVYTPHFKHYGTER